MTDRSRADALTTTSQSNSVPQPGWAFVVLVAAAIAISYFDRQSVSVAIAAIQRSIPISQQQFSWLSSAFLVAYAVMYVGGGRLLDHIGTRRGFLLIMLWWSSACAMHGLVRSFSWLLLARFLLGVGEGGAFPAATRVVAEWIPLGQRSTAMGIINAGTAVGAVLAPPLIGFLVLHSGWRSAFFVSGGIGFAWTLWWAVSYRNRAADVSASPLHAPRLSFRRLIGFRSVQALVLAKFMSDAAWYFLLFWLPKYLYDARGFDIRHVGLYAWIPYAASGVGSFLGGYFSAHLLRTGRSLDFSRKLVLGINAATMPAVMLVPLASVPMAMVLFSLAFFSQQSWSGLIMTIPADICPLSAVGTVAGMVGFGGSIGGAIFGVVAGSLLGHGVGYGTLFVLTGLFHLVGFIALIVRGGRLEPLQSKDWSETFA